MYYDDDDDDDDNNYNNPSRVRHVRLILASSNSLFTGLPSLLRSFGLQFSIIFGILLFLFILVARRSQFDLHLLSFLSTGSAFNSSKISSFLLWSKMVYLAVLQKSFNKCIELRK